MIKEKKHNKKQKKGTSIEDIVKQKLLSRYE